MNSFAAACSALTDEQLRAKTDEFKARLAAGASLDSLLPEAFAVRTTALCGLRQRGEPPPGLTPSS